jgi:hypothetical protein
MGDRIPVAMPQAKAPIAPLALNTRKRGRGAVVYPTLGIELLKRGDLDGLNPVKFQGSPPTTILLTKLAPARSARLRENKYDTARHPAWPASKSSTPRAHQ